jgi:hypothetical protein
MVALRIETFAAHYTLEDFGIAVYVCYSRLAGKSHGNEPEADNRLSD